jgi:hypothetical protein
MASTLRPYSAARAAGLDADLLRCASLLIYCRSSVILSLLIFGGLGAKLYSDLYVHLIRQATRRLAGGGAPPAVLFVGLLLATLYFASRTKPWTEKAAMLVLAANLGVFLLRGESRVNSQFYQLLCVVSLALDLSLLALVAAFYRRYPPLLRLAREAAAAAPAPQGGAAGRSSLSDPAAGRLTRRRGGASA